MKVQFMLEYGEDLVDDETLGRVKVVDTYDDLEQYGKGYEILEVDVDSIAQIKRKDRAGKFWIAETTDKPDRCGIVYVTTWTPSSLGIGLDQDGGEEMKKIQMKTVDFDGSERIRTARSGVTVDEVEAAMERTVLSGFAQYAAVIVDGEIVAEMEV